MPYRPLLFAILIPLLRLPAEAAFVSFEARHTHPLTLTPDGAKLLALHSPEGRLAVFDVSNPAQATPILTDEIPVGLEPVSVRMRTADEAWVVNELSDSISIVSLNRRCVVATLQVRQRKRGTI